MRTWTRFAPAMAIALFPVVASAQTGSTIEGTVTDPSAAVLAGATVTARQIETGAIRETRTSRDGRYVLPQLSPGAYEIRAELQGFKPLVRRGLLLTVGQTVVIDLTLELGPMDEAVTVTADASLVDTRSSDLSYLVGESAVRDLPLNGRNYTDLTMLQPAVSPFPHRDGGSVVAHGLAMSIHGQDPRSNVYLLDGTLLNDFTNAPAGSAAGTALGMETVREFRVQTSAYSAEFGRNYGGQINVVTKSGTNDPAGSLYEFHRNDALDARNYFDRDRKPDFVRNQFGGTIGGPLRRDRLFFFLGVERLQESLGRTISTVVPDDEARQGRLPDPARPGERVTVGVHPAVQPYLLEFPRANGAPLGGGLAEFTFPFDQRIRQTYGQGRIDLTAGPNAQAFARYTIDDAFQTVPMDFPQFPRSPVSRNQFFTAEHRQVFSPHMLSTTRLGFSRTRIGQIVEANTAAPLDPFVPGRPMMGDIDIGGIPRFGPQSSANVRLVQNVFSLQQDLVRSGGGHVIKAGGLVEHYQDNMVNPTFSLGIFRFADLRGFLLNQPLSFIGLRPEGQIDRYWRFTLFGVYLQDEMRAGDRVTINAGLRYETTTMPKDKYGRDSALVTLSDREPAVGQLYKGPARLNFSPRLGAAWDPVGDGRTSVRAGYGLYFNTNNQQNLIVTVTNPPATPRIVISNPTFPVPPFARGVGNSIRPIQWDLKTPRVHLFNVNVQRELWFDVVATAGYVGSRGYHLLRSGDVNVPTPIRQADGTLFFPPPAQFPRPNPAFTTIELKTSDGRSWYNAFVLDMRRRLRHGVMIQSSYTLASNIDTTQASTFFSDSTAGTTSAFPEFIPDYNKGYADFHARHTWVTNFTWQIPAGRAGGGVGGLLGGWQLSGIVHARSGNPLTVFVQANRSRSQWAPSLGPTVGADRPSFAPGYNSRNAVLGRPDQWFDPRAFVLQPAGTFGNTPRGAFIGPNLRTVDLALTRRVDLPSPAGARLEVRLELFNAFNRVNFGPPSVIAFAGQRDGEAVLPSFGRIRSTVTSARQMQLGVRLVF